MKVVRRIEITDAILTFSNVPEAEAQWDVDIEYDLGDIVRGTGDYEHQLFISAANLNEGFPVTDASKWTPYSATNAWSAFDKSVGRQTINAETIEWTFEPEELLNAIGLQNVDAAEVQIIATDPEEGVVYDETWDMVSDSGISDWYAYWTEPVVRIPDLTILDPWGLYSNLSIQFIIRSPGGSPRVGELVLGQYLDMGGTAWGAEVSAQDYSTFNEDIFGGQSVVRRAYAKRAEFGFHVPAPSFNAIYDTLTDLRATPVLMIGDEDYGPTVVYGYIRDFSITVSSPGMFAGRVLMGGLA